MTTQPNLLSTIIPKQDLQYVVPGTPVSLHFLSVLEECQGGVTSDLVILADGLSLGAIDLCDLYGLILLEVLGKLVPGGSEFLKTFKILN